MLGIGISKDAYYQPDVAARYIKPGDHVLELGSGQGANVYKEWRLRKGQPL